MEGSSIELRARPSDHQERRHVDNNETRDLPPIPLSPRSSITAREAATTDHGVALWPIVVFIFYTALTLFTWISLCIMSKHPLRKEKSWYSNSLIYLPSWGVSSSLPDRPEYWYKVSERYYRAAQILQPIVTLITIPVTTAICSTACVVYMQHGSLRTRLTLQQSMALADQGWVYPRILKKVATLGSLPLYAAFALTLLGSVAQVLQNVLVEQESILAKSGGSSFNYVKDISTIISPSDDRDGSWRDYKFIFQLRKHLESPYSSGDDINRWGKLAVPYPYDDSLSDFDKAPGNTYAPLTSNFNIGVYPSIQYAPRINSSVSYINVPLGEYEERCQNKTDSGGFYAKYEYHDPQGPMDDVYSKIIFEACIPKDLRITPWSPTRNRQDISEELYLGIYLVGTNYGFDTDMHAWKLSADTSLGWFELPGEINNNTAGELLDEDPFTDDKTQLPENYYGSAWGDKRSVNVSYSGNNTLSIVRNRGPLASIALALFGRFSFLESRMTNTSRFVFPPDYINKYEVLEGSGDCIYSRPLWRGTGSDYGCITHSSSLREANIMMQVEEFLGPFYRGNSSDDLLRSLNDALYKANKLWLSGSTEDSTTGENIKISYDEGVPATKPKISNASIIVVSMFLALHLLGLLSLAIYIFLMRPWCGTMGAEVMLKMGMVYSDALARSETKYQWKAAVGGLPGYIGDERPNEKIGRLRLGAPDGLAMITTRRRKFEVLR